MTFPFPQYDIVGHSGDGCDIELVRADRVPKNDKERLKVLKVRVSGRRSALVGHSALCPHVFTHSLTVSVHTAQSHRLLSFFYASDWT